MDFAADHGAAMRRTERLVLFSPPLTEPTIIDAAGRLVEVELREVGTQASDIGFYDLPDDFRGIQLWEGKVFWVPGARTPQGDSEDELIFDGKIRKLTPRELEHLAVHGTLYSELSILTKIAIGAYVPEDLDDFIEDWHQTEKARQDEGFRAVAEAIGASALAKVGFKLHEYLGMTREEYGRWVKDPAVISEIVEQRWRTRTELAPGVFSEAQLKPPASFYLPSPKELELRALIARTGRPDGDKPLPHKTNQPLFPGVPPFMDGATSGTHPPLEAAYRRLIGRRIPVESTGTDS